MNNEQGTHNPYQMPVAAGDAPSYATPGTSRPILGVLAGYLIIYISGAITSLAAAYLMGSMSTEQMMLTYKLVVPAIQFVIRILAAYLCARMAHRAEHVPLIVLFCLAIVMPYVIRYLWLHTAYFYFDIWSFILTLVAILIGGWLAWDKNRKIDERYTASLRSFDAPVE